MKTSEQAESIHAHEVMEMMIASGERYSRDTLVASIAERFGEGAVFHACCAEGMASAELIDFLWSKGKLSGTQESFIFDPMDQCQGH